MSRIQTPTVAVNPNVELASREAPTIVYQPERYVPETYFDYEQLSDVLGAGVQAAKTFLETSLLDRKLQAEVAAQAAKEQSDRFRIGLSEAERLDEKESSLGQTKMSSLTAFVSSIDYWDLSAEDKIKLNETMSRFEKKMGQEYVQEQQEYAKRMETDFKIELEKRVSMAKSSDNPKIVEQFLVGIDPTTLSQENQILFYKTEGEFGFKDLENQRQRSAQAKKEASDRFRTDLSEAERKDKQERTGEALVNTNRLKFLQGVDRDSLSAEDKQKYDEIVGQMSDDEITQQLAFNAKIYEGMIRSASERILNAAEAGDQNAIDLLSQVTTPEQALALLESLFTPEQKANLNSIDRDDWDRYRNSHAIVVANIVGAGIKHKTKINQKVVDIKTTAMVETTAAGVSELFTKPSLNLGSPESIKLLIEDFASNLKNIRAVAKNLDRTRSSVDLDKIQDNMVMLAADDVISRGSADQLLAFRNILKQGTGIVMDPTNRIKLMEKLDAEVKKKYESELRFDLDSLSAAQMDETSVTTRSQNPMYKNQQLDNFANLARSRMYVDGPNGERIQVMDETEVNTMISNHKARIEAQDERYVPNKVYADATAILASELAKGQNARFDTAMNRINDIMLANGVLPDTPQWNAAYKNLGRFIDVEAAPRMEAMAKNQLSNAYGFPVSSLGPDAADDAKVPASLRMRFNADKAQLRIQAKAQHLRLALATKDSTGSSSSTAISNFRAGLVNLIGPNLEGPIPVELYDAAVLARDPIMRLNVFGAGSPNGDRLLRFLDMVNSAQGSASGRTMTDLIRAAQIEFTFDDARTGWTSIMSVDRESKFHKLKLDSITGEVLPVSTAWLRNLYASTFNDKMLETNGVYDQARALTGDLLEPLVLSVNGSALPANDIGARGAQHVMDMAQVLTGRDDVTFVVVGQDETGTGYLYGLRDMDGDEVTTDAAGNRIPNRLYTMQYVPEGVTSRFSLTNEAFDKQVKELNVKRGDNRFWDNQKPYKQQKKSVTLEPQPGWRGWSQGMSQE